GPTPGGTAALALLRNADDEGLHPTDYAAAELDSLARSLGGRQPADSALLTRLDMGLSLGLLRFIRHLHEGRVNPHSIGLAINPPRAGEQHDYVALVATTARTGDVASLVAAVTPPLAQYRLAREAYRRARPRPDSRS